MSDVKIIKVKSRLAELAFRGGLTAKEAIARAETALEATHPSSRASIDRLLVELDAVFATSPVEHERAYGLTTQIIDLAYCLPDSLIEHAARALCDLIDISVEVGTWDQEAVSLHLQALKVLRHSGQDFGRPQRTKLIDGLHQVTRKRIADRNQLADERAG